jgi:peptide-methionine (S)-S-oxide reductase
VQQALAQDVISKLVAAKLWDDPVVTEVVPAETFYVAETYHQEYYVRNPQQSYCAFVVAPKVAKFRKHFVEHLKK